MKVSVIISSVPERAVLLSSVLANILQQNSIPDEVLVVTDDGKGELLEYLIPDEVFEQLNARVIESGGTGLSRARNRGV
ncbi:MAG: glycosyltransferase family 2 protein, partial [Candidatus Methanospirareceae archaeon]